jgi:hypothetical protein
MPKYIIERTIPGAGALSPDQLADIAKKSVSVLQQMGPDYRWHHSYVTGGKFFCVHEAESEHAIREHSRRGGFPVDRIDEIVEVVGPSTAKSLTAA